MVQLGIWRSMDKSVFPLHSPSSLMVCWLLLVHSGHIYFMHTLSLIHEWKWFHYILFLLFLFSFLFSFRTLYCYPPKKYLKTRHPGKPNHAWKSYFQGSLTSHGGWSSGPDSRPSRWVSVRRIPGWNPCISTGTGLKRTDHSGVTWVKYYPPTSACLVRKILR